MPENSYDIINLETLNKVLSTKNNQNSKNFKMVLDRQPINYSNFFSLSLKHSTEILRFDADKVQNWISRGS